MSHKKAMDGRGPKQPYLGDLQTIVLNHLRPSWDDPLDSNSQQMDGFPLEKSGESQGCSWKQCYGFCRLSHKLLNLGINKKLQLPIRLHLIWHIISIPLQTTTSTLLGTNISHPSRHFWRWFSFSPAGSALGYVSSLEGTSHIKSWNSQTAKSSCKVKGKVW